MPDSDKNHISPAFKHHLLQECKRILDAKINSLTNSLNEVTESSNQESKSSAGDKHETTKAMMQIEQEKLGKQLSELKIQKEELNKISENTSARIGNGSLVSTSNGLFFVAIAIGKVIFNETEVFVVSPKSPVGLKLLNLNVSEFELNGQNYSVNEVI